MADADDTYLCEHCQSEVDLDGEFCSHCGTIFKPEVFCTSCKNEPAEGVCIICEQPFCGRCGSWVTNRFLCKGHEKYEIYEGMSRVFGGSDISLVRYAEGYLRDNGLHPFVYAKKASPIAIGGPDYNPFSGVGRV